MGVAFVRGLQGDDPTAGVIATAKHFVGYGASEGGMNWAPPHIGARELREVYLHPFEAAVRVGGVGAVMNAYNELDGVPVAADRGLLTTVLRDEWGFDGCVVADYFSIRQLADYHHLAVDAAEAAAMALAAGLDVELPGTDCYGAPLLQAVRSGRVSAATVDTAVARVLRAKFELGLFEQPLVEPERVAAVTDTPAHRELARTIARASLVLLRNDGVLPLRPDVGTVAVIGPNADDARNLFGDYTYPAHVESLQEVLKSGRNVFAMPIDERHPLTAIDADATTVVAALRARLGPSASFARGCDVNSASRDGFAEAVELAARVRRRGAGDGGQGRAHRRLAPAARAATSVARPAGRAGGPRPRGDRHRHPRGARAGRRTADRQRVAPRTLRGGADGVAPRSGGRRRHRRRPHRRRQPERQAADLVSPVVGSDPRLLRPQALRWAVALEGRLRRLAGEPALSVRPRAELHDLQP